MIKVFNLKLKFFLLKCQDKIRSDQKELNEKFQHELFISNTNADNSYMSYYCNNEKFYRLKKYFEGIKICEITWYDLKQLLYLMLLSLGFL